MNEKKNSFTKGILKPVYFLGSATLLATGIGYVDVNNYTEKLYCKFKDKNYLEYKIDKNYADMSSQILDNSNMQEKYSKTINSFVENYLAQNTDMQRKFYDSLPTETKENIFYENLEKKFGLIKDKTLKTIQKGTDSAYKFIKENLKEVN
jgi:hypothetical protein